MLLSLQLPLQCLKLVIKSRPLTVSQLPNLSKILGSVVLNQFMPYLENNHVLYTR